MHKDLVVNLITGQCLQNRFYHLRLEHYYQNTETIRTGALASATVKCYSVLPGIESEAMQDMH